MTILLYPWTLIGGIGNSALDCVLSNEALESKMSNVTLYINTSIQAFFPLKIGIECRLCFFYYWMLAKRRGSL